MILNLIRNLFRLLFRRGSAPPPGPAGPSAAPKTKAEIWLEGLSIIVKNLKYPAIIVIFMFLFQDGIRSILFRDFEADLWLFRIKVAEAEVKVNDRRGEIARSFAKEPGKGAAKKEPIAKITPKILQKIIAARRSSEELKEALNLQGKEFKNKENIELLRLWLVRSDINQDELSAFVKEGKYTDKLWAFVEDKKYTKERFEFLADPNCGPESLLASCIGMTRARPH